MDAKSRLAKRFKATAVHVAISALLVGAVALLVFGLWYPDGYRELAGGGRLLLLIAGVDIVLGPMLTLAVFDVRKPKAELVRDVGVIALLQAAALAYGLWTMAAARPVHEVFEVDLFRVVMANEVYTGPLQHQGATPTAERLGAPLLPWTGPTTLGVLKPLQRDAAVESIMLGGQGVHLASLAAYWVPYEAVRAQALARSRPWSDLKPRNSAEAKALEAAVKKLSSPREQLRWVPLVSSRASWVALLDAQGNVVARAAVSAL
jgi:hypothetical protein